MSAGEAVEFADRFPGLGLVLNASNYAAARDLRVRPVAYVNSSAHAAAVARDPTAWAFAVLGDERNITGLSGAREEPEEYMARMEPARAILEAAGVRTSSAGLGMLGGIFGRFDHAYAAALRGWTNQAGVNLSPMQYRAAARGIRQHEGAFFVTLLPQRAAWKPENTILAGILHRYLVIPSLGRQFRALARDPRVAGVGVWCLREVRNRDGSYQAHHGLLDRRNRVTWQGELLRRVLRGIA